MRITVTGAAGNLGRWVVGACVAAGHTVTGLDRVPVPDRVPSGPGGAGSRHVVAALNDEAVLREVATGSDAVVHLAALPSPRHGTGATVFGNNVLGTFRVLDVAAAAGVGHVVLASSLSALGMAWATRPFAPDYLPVDEDHPLTPQDPYGLSKVVDERTAAAFVAAGALDVTALRLPLVLHPHHVPDPDHPEATAAERLPLELFGYVDVRDAAAAVVQSLAVRPPGLAVLNITAADTRSPAATPDLCAAHYPDVPLRRALADHESLYAIDRAAALIGYAPSRSWRGRLPRNEERP